MFINLKNTKAFTLIELLMVVAIISLLSSVIFSSLKDARAKSRDAKRKMEIHQIELGLEQYILVNGKYPVADHDGCSGWDVGNKDYPLLNVKMTGIMDNVPRDLTKTGNCDGYFYYVYPAGSFSCSSSWGDFYILGAKLEKETKTLELPSPCNYNFSWTGLQFGIYKFEKH